MAVSGKCYLSLDNLGSSANRGACLQVCRRAYTVRDRDSGVELDVDNKYIMSPKDLCTIGFIDRMMKAGVRVFKIEGRARGADYVYTTVSCYKEAISAVLDGTFTSERVEEWKNACKRCSTAASGTVTTWASVWASGAATTARRPRSARNTWARA